MHGDGGPAMNVSLDTALEKNPIGPFHYMLLILCGFSFMSDALEVNLLSFLATCAGDEWNLSDTEQASITSAVFGGIICGSVFWGSFADRYGRRTCFLAAASVISIAGFMTCIAPSFPYLLAFRAIVGFGIGGANVPFDLLAEFLPANSRGSFLILIEYFWTLGSMFVAGTAWLFLGQYGWRVLAGITAVPIAITSIASIWYLPESPRWLLSQGRREDAERAVAWAYSFNGHSMAAILGGNVRLYAEEVTYSHEDNDKDQQVKARRPAAKSVAASSALGTASSSSVVSPMASHGDANPTSTPESPFASEEDVSYLDILRDKDMRRVTLPLWVVWALFGFTYYGLILFVTRVYSKNDDDDSSTCSFDYASIFYNSLSELAGTTVAVLFIERIGRVNVQIIFYAVAGVLVGLIGAPIPSAGVLVLSFVSRMSLMASTNATWVLTPELYRTEYRTFAHAICVTMSKLGAFVSPYIVVSAFDVPTVAVILGICNLIAAFAAYMLPDSTGLTLGKGRRNTFSLVRSKSFSVDGEASDAQLLSRSLLADELSPRQKTSSRDNYL